MYVQGWDCGDYNWGSVGSARVREGVLEARSMAAMVVTCGLVEAGRGRVIRCVCVRVQCETCRGRVGCVWESRPLAIDGSTRAKAKGECAVLGYAGQ